MRGRLRSHGILLSVFIRINVMFRLFLIAVLILAALFVLGVSQTMAPAHQPSPQATVRFGDAIFSLDIAATPLEQARGLAGRREIPERGGMLFIFRESGMHAFWMKGMVASIDIIWVRGDEIVGFIENASPPLPGTIDDDLERFRSPSAVDRVIELRAGSVSSLGIMPGQKVGISIP